MGLFWAPSSQGGYLLWALGSQVAHGVLCSRVLWASLHGIWGLLGSTQGGSQEGSQEASSLGSGSGVRRGGVGEHLTMLRIYIITYARARQC